MSTEAVASVWTTKHPFTVRQGAELEISTVGKIFEQQVRRRPDAVALQLGERRVSYAALERMSSAVAVHLRQHGVSRGSHVGFVLSDRVAQIVAMLGIIRAGGAYVPFDLANPHPALAAMASDSGIVAMLADAAGPGRVVMPFWTVPTLECPAIADNLQTLHEDDLVEAVPDRTAPGDVAYVMFTSGSTGRAKPVAVPHRGILRLVVGADYAAFGPDETFLQLAPLAFDAATFEIWGALLTGARLVLTVTAQPSLDDIAQLIMHRGITTLWLTAGLFHLMVDKRPEALSPLRQLLAGGDVLSPAHVGRALRAMPGGRLINGYGPTENTTFTCCYSIRPGDENGPIPIGTPIAGTSVHILDADLQPVAAGEVGELYAGGDGVALGYLNLPELTRERFSADPFAPEPGGRLYRTGDLVRRRPDGNLEFHGRRDGQVKLDGKRVELAAIEAAVRDVSQRAGRPVRDVVVTVAADQDGKRIVAHLQEPDGIHVADATASGEPQRLRAALLEVLPSYMVPAAFMAHRVFPLTPNGKIDRSALNAAFLSHHREAQPGARPASSRIEGVVAEIWSRALGMPNPPSDRNFFDLGGTSLKLMSVHAEMKTRLRSDLAMTDLFAHPTIASLAAHLSREGAATAATLAARDRGALQREAFARLRRGRA